MATSESSEIKKVDKVSLDKLKSNIKKNGSTIILYHWNRCGHCISFMPVWQQLKQMLADRYNFYDIELQTMQQAPYAFNSINSFPTIRMYLTNGKITYDGSRDLNSISSFIKEKIPPSPKSSSPKSSSPKSSSSKSKSKK